MRGGDADGYLTVMTDQLPFAASDLDTLRTEASGCTRCHLYKDATQTVFGAGPPSADLMLVGEQPGDQEDLQGAPFVGPAGGVLEGEIVAVQPDVVVLMGATAAKALLGSSFRVTAQRGEVFPRDGYHLTATVHPSSILRVPGDRRQQAYEDFVADLSGVAKLLS